MAGSLMSAASEQLETETTTNNTLSFSQLIPICAVIDEWEVEYARFVNYPPLDNLPSTHSSLTPHSLVYRKRSKGGVWIKTSADDGGAFLKLIPDRSTGFDDAVLVVSLSDNIIEEHYLSKLHFSWPQVSCVSGFPSRGTRAVFVSYKDSDGQMKKFALRFSTVNETEKFISVLKKLLEDKRPKSLPWAEFETQVSSQSEFVPSNLPSCKSASVESSIHRRPTSVDYEVTQPSNNQEMVLHNEAEEILSAFPPSFTSFLMNCCPSAEQGEMKPTVSEDAKLKDQITKYLKDPSFQDVLVKAEKLITELGDDIIFS